MAPGAKPIDYAGRMVLAPMVRVGTLPMRLLALEHGAHLVWSPELVDKKLVGCRRLVNARLRTVDYLWHRAWAPAGTAPNADYDGDALNARDAGSGNNLLRNAENGSNTQYDPAHGSNFVCIAENGSNTQCDPANGSNALCDAKNESSTQCDTAFGSAKRPRVASDYDEDVPADAALIFRTCAAERGRLVVQLGSASPALALAAARVVAPDAAGIDLNCGCPKPFSTHAGMGAALLQTPDVLVAIVAALAAPGALPAHVGVSAKIRMLPTAAQTAALVRRIVEAGADAVTLHCRFPADRTPKDPATYAQLRAAVLAAAPKPLIVNGDLYSVAHARRVLSASGASSAMFARPAMWDPSIFSQCGAQNERVICADGGRNRKSGDKESSGMRQDGLSTEPDVNEDQLLPSAIKASTVYRGHAADAPGAVASEVPSDADSACAPLMGACETEPDADPAIPTERAHSAPTFDDLVRLSRRYLALAAQTDNPFANTKYVLSQMWSTRPAPTRAMRDASAAILAARDISSLSAVFEPLAGEAQPA